MKLLTVGSRFHEGNPRRGSRSSALALIRALRRRAEVEHRDPVFWKDPGEEIEGIEALLLLGQDGLFWRVFEACRDRARRLGLPLVGLDLEDGEMRRELDLDLATELREGSRFFPPWVDPGIFRPREGERTFPPLFVGRVDGDRRRFLEALESFPLRVEDSGDPGRPRLPSHTLASWYARSRAVLDLPGRRREALHFRAFEILASGGLALVPESRALSGCLEPGVELPCYRDAGELRDLLGRMLSDPALFEGICDRGGRRVVEAHSVHRRAKDLIELCGGPQAGISLSDGPKVCVYMACWNQEAFLAETLKSIQGQTWRNLEIRVVDDGSTDGSWDLLRSKASGDPRIHPMRVSHRGQSVARNHALRNLSGDVLFLMNHDSDDLSHPRKIAALVDFLERRPEIHLVGCQADYLHPGGAGSGLRLPCDPEEIDRDLHLTNPLIHSAVLFRREVLERVPGYRERFRPAEDYDFFARILEAGFRAANLPRVLHRIRLHPGSLGASRGEEMSGAKKALEERLSLSRSWRLALRDGKKPGLRLHLGCGERYLEGYVNVDFPGKSHPVQKRWDRDLVEDIRYLVLPPGSCREVRLHHVFEHFPRAEGLRLLLEWHLWLEEGGELVLETPDLERSLQKLHPGSPPELRAKVLRHLFGSQEAGWALHMDAYDEPRFRHLLPGLGFEQLEVERSEWNDIANITVRAHKVLMDREEQWRAARAFLDEAMVDGSETEQRLRSVWQEQLEGAALGVVR